MGVVSRNSSESRQGDRYGSKKKKHSAREFPGGPVVRTPCFHCGGVGSIPGQGTKIPQAVQCGQKTKTNKQKTQC